MFLPGHRSLVAHAECAGTPRVMREAQMKTPNREQLGAEFWWPVAESNHGHADFQNPQRQYIYYKSTPSITRLC